MVTANIIGSGPNGLAAAVTLAQAGVDVTVYERSHVPGGGARSGEVTLPGLIHDHCAGFHPLAVDNEFVTSAGLSDYGLEWAVPEVQYAHPLDDGHGAAAYRSLERTAQELLEPAWQRLFGPLSEHFQQISADISTPMLQLPTSPLQFARFGLRAGMPAQLLAQLLETQEAKALFAGVAAHAFQPLHRIGSSSIGVTLLAAGHSVGWPVAKGGSAAIVDALLAALHAHGGTVVTDADIQSLADLPKADVVMLNTAPAAAADIVGHRVPRWVASWLRRFRYGPAASTVSLAVEGGIPWTYEPARRAGTVHVGGSLPEIAFVERQVTQGRMPRNPFVLVSQQSVADPSRAQNGVHPVDAYAHVPHGYPHDATDLIINQLERFAPGVRERIIAKTSRTTADIEAENPNFVGGDIVSGSNAMDQLLFRPRPAINPYRLGVPGVYLCSAATPPGAGAHGMAGYNAATTALAELH